jgi:hypothetical protein
VSFHFLDHSAGPRGAERAPARHRGRRTGIHACLQFGKEAAHAGCILPEVRGTVAGSGTHIDARADIVAFHAHDDIVGEANHRRQVGRL